MNIIIDWRMWLTHRARVRNVGGTPGSIAARAYTCARRAQYDSTTDTVYRLGPTTRVYTRTTRNHVDYGRVNNSTCVRVFMDLFICNLCLKSSKQKYRLFQGKTLDTTFCTDFGRKLHACTELKVLSNIQCANSVEML